ncbi:OmpP1/FadL family transporter [Caulobacter sp. S45]|uniref:OmpP1/FadL family transporter n=1 Tax=Caulobacter sp. S45 TaxID=1641861 RepID=UPI0020B142ED|nr:outer membrane protein transport protein [Caulobacter sp. S45]
MTALMIAGQAHAAGFYLEDQSTKGSGRAFSGEASDSGSESLFYNPSSIAGMTGLEFSSSATAILADAKVTDTGSTITRPGQAATSVGGAPRAYNPVEPGVIPSSAIAYGLPHGFAIGLSVTSPFSFATKYDADSFVRYAADSTRLTTIDVQPTIAWRPVRWLGLGAGPVIEYSNAVFSSASPQLTPGPDGFEFLHGDGWNAGYTVGAQLHPDDRVTVGLSYRSKIDHTLNGGVQVTGLTGLLALGGANLNQAAQAKFTTPWTATFGVRWKVTDRLSLEGQGVRFGWSEFSQIQLPSPLSNVIEGYHDTTSGAVGLDYDVTPRWTMRAGVQYDPTPTPNVGRDARVPDSNRYLFAMGTTYKATSRLKLDAAISYVDFQKSHIDRDATAYPGTIAVTPISIQGDVEASAVTMSLGSRFTF